MIRSLTINYDCFQGPKSGQNRNMLPWGHSFSSGMLSKGPSCNHHLICITRFISPAVVQPEIVDIEVPKNENTGSVRRGLMVVARIIQNLANNLFFGKQPHMVALNKFLESNITNVTRFLSELHVSFTPRLQRVMLTFSRNTQVAPMISTTTGLEPQATKPMSSFYIDSSTNMPTKSGKSY